jgi:predicted 3-demethylubiquinone-9 3-methyltransferase (glyoxalase superfamily)
MDKTTPCLWFDGDAEEAAAFYVTLLPDSRIDKVVRAPADNPSMAKGGVLLVEFTLAGQKYSGLNGGPQFRFTEAVSFMVHCEDQEEVDRLWNAILENGGEASACGWIKDRWGLAWQITPRRLLEMIASEDRAAAERAMEKMMEMVKLDLAELEAAYRGDSAAA